MAFHLQTKQEQHANITSFDLKMRPHHRRPQNTVRKKKDSIKHKVEKSLFSCHSSRTPALLTSNQVDLHWPLHLAAANPQITENFMIKHDWRVPRSRFIHDTFSPHLFAPSLSLVLTLFL